MEIKGNFSNFSQKRRGNQLDEHREKAANNFELVPAHYGFIEQFNFPKTNVNNRTKPSEKFL